MTYTTAWANGTAGRLTPAVDWLRSSDAIEAADAISRRLMLTFQEPLLAPGAVSAATLAGMRTALLDDVLIPPTGSLGGQPPSPGTMQWLWPLEDADAGKLVVSGRDGVGDGEVGLLQHVCGGAEWTDAALAGAFVRAVHWNELRHAIECVTRGRLRLPVYMTGGLFSILPDMPWAGGMVANNGVDELRSCGFAIFHARSAGGHDIGLRDIEVLPTSRIEITTDVDCRLAVYRCLRPMNSLPDGPTWNQYRPSTDDAWEQPGGLGTADAVVLGQAEATAGMATAVSGPAVAAALEVMADGGEPNFTIRRLDNGPQTVGLSVCLVVEFDLKSPPN